MKFRKGYVDAPTGQVHYREMGEGEPLLLLHQSPASSLQFEAAYPFLARAGIRAIGMDTPGFGMSDIPDFVPRIEDYAAVVPSVLDALGLERCAVLGHHTGAAIACQFAADHAERVTKLILNGPPLWTEEERRQRLERPHTHFEPKPDGSHLMEMWALRSRATPGWTNVRAMERGITWRLVAGELEWYGHRAAYEHDTLTPFKALRVPTLILTNTTDDIYDCALRGHELRPDFAFEALPGGTHDIVDEQPEAWAAAVARFLGRII